MKKIGIIGCGNISGIFLKNLHSLFPDLKVIAISDLDSEQTRVVTDQYPDIEVQTSEQLLKNPHIDIELNITTPPVHTRINKIILEAGKYVYVEKPLTLDLEEADDVLKLAASKNLRIGCAPDTVLGAGIQTYHKIAFPMSDPQYYDLSRYCDLILHDGYQSCELLL